MKKVLILAHSFPPEGGSGVQRITKYCKYLPEYGWDPIVLTSGSHHPITDYELVNEVHERVRVYRVPDVPVSNFRKTLIGRILLRAVILPHPSMLWAKKAIKVAREILHSCSVSAVLTTEPVGAHWLGWKLKQEFGIPWVMDIRDLWTGNFAYRPLSFFHGLIDKHYERKFLLDADRVIVVTGGYITALKGLYPTLPNDKMSLIPNGYDEDDFSRITANKTDKFTVTYVGSLYSFKVWPRAIGWKRLFEPIIKGGPAIYMRNPEIILKAVKYFVDHFPDVSDDLRLKFVGAFPHEFEKLICKHELEGIVEIVGYVDHSKAIEEMLMANILILLQDGDGSEIVVPGKLYEYLRSGTPILGLLRKGIASQIIEETKTGISISPDDFPALTAQLNRWYQNWKSDSSISDPDWTRINNFERKKQAAQLASILSSLDH